MTVFSHLLLLCVLATPADAEPAASPPGNQLDIASDSSCPSADAVQGALASLRPATSWPADLVVIRATPEWLSIDLGRGSRRLRQLAMEPDCAARAASAALVIATWMDDLPAVVTGAPVLFNHDDEAETPSLPVRKPVHHETGAGLLAAVGGGMAPGMYGEFIRLRPQGDLGWQASIALVSPREVWLAGGTSHWMRTALTLGGQARKTYARLFLAADLGLAWAYTAAWGTGYGKDQTDGSFTWGAVASMRAGIPWTRVRLWTAVRAGWWLRGESIQVDARTPAGSVGSELPSWEAQGLLGMSYLLP